MSVFNARLVGPAEDPLYGLCLCCFVCLVFGVFFSGDFLDEGLFVWDVAIETLSGEDTSSDSAREPTACLGV